MSAWTSPCPRASSDPSSSQCYAPSKALALGCSPLDSKKISIFSPFSILYPLSQCVPREGHECGTQRNSLYFNSYVFYFYINFFKDLKNHSKNFEFVDTTA